MITSETSMNTAPVTVRFTLAHSGLDGQRFAVVGDFNGWDPGATPMDGQDGTYTATITLHPGRYRFRYLAEDGTWFNDDAADDYEPNDHGGQDSILDLTPGSTRGDRGEAAHDSLGPDRLLDPAQDIARPTVGPDGSSTAPDLNGVPDPSGDSDLVMEQARISDGAAVPATDLKSRVRTESLR